MIRSLPLTALSLMLGFFFVFVGVLKISPSVNADIYKHMVCFFLCNNLCSKNCLLIFFQKAKRIWKI